MYQFYFLQRPADYSVSILSSQCSGGTYIHNILLQVEYFVRTRLTQLVSAELQGPIVRQSLVAGGLCLALSLINRYLKERDGRKVESLQHSNFLLAFKLPFLEITSSLTVLAFLELFAQN